MRMPTKRRPRPIVARFVHWHDHGGSADTGEFRTTRITLDAPPVPAVSKLESIMHGWWLRSPGYPVGRMTGTPIPAPHAIGQER